MKGCSTVKTKLQYLVTVNLTESHTKNAIIRGVRDSVSEHFEHMDIRTSVKEYKGEPVVAANPELIDSVQALNEDLRIAHDRIKELEEEAKVRRGVMLDQATAITELNATVQQLKDLYNRDIEQASHPAESTIRVVNGLIAIINSVDHTPEKPMAYQKGEYWKKGGRAALSKVNAAIQQAAHTLLDHLPEAGDGELFNYWIQEAATRPSRLAKALAPCVAPDEFRLALKRLQHEDVKAIEAGRINPDGGLVQ